MPNISKKNKPYSAADMRAVSDNPEWTRKDFAKAKRFEEIFPDLARTIRRRGKQKAPIKKAVSMRLDTDVLEAYKATGAKWQSRINSDLRKVMKLG
ncbi:MAG: hypothetical protein QOH67_1251 [Hyphomicrobiales bacterium]|nr:hypothetical protein [Hyphomicrobiales bacterium]